MPGQRRPCFAFASLDGSATPSGSMPHHRAIGSRHRELQHHRSDHANKGYLSAGKHFRMRLPVQERDDEGRERMRQSHGALRD